VQIVDRRQFAVLADDPAGGDLAALQLRLPAVPHRQLADQIRAVQCQGKLASAHSDRDSSRSSMLGPGHPSADPNQITAARSSILLNSYRPIPRKPVMWGVSVRTTDQKVRGSSPFGRTTFT
jgi:hypothetical protein